MTAPATAEGTSSAIRPGFSPPPVLRRIGGLVLNAYAAFVLLYLFLPVAVAAIVASAIGATRGVGRTSVFAAEAGRGSAGDEAMTVAPASMRAAVPPAIPTRAANDAVSSHRPSFPAAGSAGSSVS